MWRFPFGPSCDLLVLAAVLLLFLQGVHIYIYINMDVFVYLCIYICICICIGICICICICTCTCRCICICICICICLCRCRCRCIRIYIYIHIDCKLKGLVQSKTRPIPHETVGRPRTGLDADSMEQRRRVLGHVVSSEEVQICPQEKWLCMAFLKVESMNLMKLRSRGRAIRQHSEG